MNHSEFFAAVKAGQIAPCYLFEGTEEYTKESALRTLQGRISAGDFGELNETRLTDPDADTLIATADTFPFMADKRLVIVLGSAMLQSGKAKEYDEDESVKKLTAYLDNLPDTACIVFMVRGKADGRKKLYTQLKKKAAHVQFEPLTDRELTQWMAQLMKKAGKKISADTCQRLWFAAGRDLTHLGNEIEKLIAFADGRDEVTAEDIDAVCTRTAEYKVFDMASMLLLGDGAGAFTLMNGLLQEGEDRLFLLTLLGRQCRQLLYIKQLSGQRLDPGALAAQVGLPPFAMGRMTSQAARYTAAQLQAMCDWCVEAEYGVKSGELMDVGSLEQVMLKILALKEKT